MPIFRNQRFDIGGIYTETVTSKSAGALEHDIITIAGATSGPLAAAIEFQNR
jgi:hypothetical protein